MQAQRVLNTAITPFTLSLLILLVLSSLPQIAQANNDWTRMSDGRRLVTRPGAFINEAGSYVLRYDLWANSGDGVVIRASGVTIDLNGFEIGTRSRGAGRGIFIDGVSGVTIKNGRVGGFLTNVMVANATNVVVQNLQIVGLDLAPSGGPSEIGVQLLNSRAALIKGNTISSVNLGIFVRGGGSTGNRITENTVVGGAIPAHALFGICYNPPPTGGNAGPRGDLIYNNHVARFGFAVGLSEFSINNVFRDNTYAVFTRAYDNTQFLVANGGTNASSDNITTILPATMLQ
jgi:parallel beta-helix repeat protein